MQITRRRLLETFGTAAVATASFPNLCVADDTHLDSAIQLLQESPSLDLHCHPGNFARRGAPTYGGDGFVRRTVGDMQVGHMWGGFFSVVADSVLLERGPDGISVNRDFEPGEAWALYKKQMSDLKELLSTMPAVEAHVAEDIELLHSEGSVAAFIGCEGGHCLDGRIEHLEEMFDDGVLLLQLVHYAMNDIGDLQTLDPVFNGLSPFGRDVIREMDRLGMIIDVAHASFETVIDVAEASENPMVLSHSQLSTDLKRHPRLIEPDHAKVVADTGGVIGMWPSGFGNDTMQDFVDNTMRLIDLIGVEHVGLGTDMDSNYKPVLDSYRQVPEWAAGLLESGLSKEEVAKVVGGNALRVIEAVA
jgi:membrane dipeptidase